MLKRLLNMTNNGKKKSILLLNQRNKEYIILYIIQIPTYIQIFSLNPHLFTEQIEYKFINNNIIFFYEILNTFIIEI